MASLVASSNSAFVPTILDAPYDPKAFDSLPGLGLAAHKFKEMDAMTKVVGPIRDLFLRHRVHTELGLSLLHKHFPIGPTQRLVDCRNVAAAWDVGDDLNAITNKHGNSIVPRSFQLAQGKWVPYEFDFTKPSEQLQFSAQVSQKFLSELSILLCDLGMDQIVGLRALDKHDSNLTVEVTEGKMNIMVARGDISDDQLIEALWIFGVDEDDRCHCNAFCQPSSNGHYENHSCG
ncbi:hypothetical protein GGR51DRAFT_515735 [Nemania sp. FL0031]|nr:hypothetical protein GGR51DRAFT_515735 [Nemania sp. FL0031]